MHTPVLLQKVLEIFNPQPGQKYIDATTDGGGHSRAIAKRILPKGEVFAIDWDCALIEEARSKNRTLQISNIKFICGNYAALRIIAEHEGFGTVSGILFDLGFSSYHTERSGRGFSFLRDEPLDMRYDPNGNPLTAEEILNVWPPERIEKILRDWGEERFAKSIARAIATERKKNFLKTTFQLVAVIRAAVPAWYAQRKIHCATKTFQAIRIAVNRELENLSCALQDSFLLLAPGGKLIVISFHSLEDRIVKRVFREQGKNGFRIFTKHVLRPRQEEVEENPRARSARLRAIEKRW